MTLSTQTVRGAVGRLALTTSGEGGEPVLFVHGNSGNRTQWAAQQSHLKQRGVSSDLRGMGGSEADAEGRYYEPVKQLGPLALHLRAPRVQVKVLSKVSHWLMMDAPESFNAALDELLAGRPMGD